MRGLALVTLNDYCKYKEQPSEQSAPVLQQLLSDQIIRSGAV